MYRAVIVLILCVISHHIAAHEFTPTYPKLKQSYLEEVLYTTMILFNTRKDVNYYSVGVFDENWEDIPFATESKLISVKHLQRKKIDIYIRERDKKRAMYICSKSKIQVSGGGKTSIVSRICSKIE
jgi:hypothetical protein